MSSPALTEQGLHTKGRDCTMILWAIVATSIVLYAIAGYAAAQ